MQMGIIFVHVFLYQKFGVTILNFLVALLQRTRMYLNEIIDNLLLIVF